MTMTRPPLRPVPLQTAIQPGQLTVTMSVGQWDVVHQVAYDAGCILLELNDDEQPLAAYRLHDDELVA